MTVKITFGMIVLNGEPFVRYNLRSLYPFAHQIVVIEGACPGARSVATRAGHSADGTLETLRRFQMEEDPERKLTIITAEDEGHTDGFWSEKDEMSQAYARRATGGFLWQVDCDEFYVEEDMRDIIKMLRENRGITGMSFRTITFWGGLEYQVDGFALRRADRDFHRLFAWGKNYMYASHRPPTVLDPEGKDLRQLRWIPANELASRGIYMYHYALLLPKQVMEKFAYYSSMNWSFMNDTNNWTQVCFSMLRNPFRVYYGFKSLSWLNRYRGIHPSQAREMVRAISRGEFPEIILRPTQDIEQLLNRKAYSAGKIALKCLVPFDSMYHAANKWTRRTLARLKLVEPLKSVLSRV